MNPRTTQWLLILALALGAFIYFFERHSSVTAPHLSRKLLPDLDALSVTSLELRTSNALIRVERTNDAWRMTHPVVYPAQRTAIDDFLALLGQLPLKSQISAQEILEQPGGLKAFGLELPLANLMIKQGTRPLELRIGGKTLLGRQLYVQRVGQDGIYVTEAQISERLPLSSADWRDRRLLDLAGNFIDRLQLQADARRLDLQWEPEIKQWRLLEPLKARANSPLIDSLIQALQNVRVTQFVSDNPSADLEPFGLHSHDLELIISKGTNRLVEIQFGRSPTNFPGQIYARRLSHSNIVVVSKDLVDLLRAPYTKFLDQRLIPFDPATVERIEVHAAENFALQRQTNNLWEVLAPAGFAADSVLVREFLDQLRSLEIIEWAKEVVTELDLPNYGLASPLRQYILRGPLTVSATGSTNPVIAQIDVGMKKDEDKIFVRRIDETPVYLAKVEAVQQLPQAAFELRERQIWSFTTNQVTSVTLSVQGQTRRFVRNASGSWVISAGSQGVFTPLGLEETLYRLGQLQAQRWVARGDARLANLGFPQTAHQITLEVQATGGPKALALELGRRPYASVFLEGETERLIFEVPPRIYLAYDQVLRELNLPPPQNL